MPTLTHRARSAAGLALALAGLGAAASTAVAAPPPARGPGPPPAALAPAVPLPTVSSGRTCTDDPERAFAAYGDDRGYVLVPGGDFSSTAGWQLGGGAAVLTAPQRDGRLGRVLSIPPGGSAVSPQFCVDLDFATARAFTRASEGEADVTVGVLSPTGTLLGSGAFAGVLSGDADWAPTDDLSADPRLAGKLGKYRSVAFSLRNSGDTTLQVDDVYLDPRMR